MSELMKKKTSFVLTVVVALVVVAIIWFGSGPLGRWLLAMHGRH
jgi:hypothetical protein